MSFTVDIQDEASPLIDAAGRAISDRSAAARAAANGALPVVQKNFTGLASSNVNPFGARGGFWNRMLSGTRVGVEGDAGFIAMPREVALRFFGGTVKPQKSKYLALPARKEAYGKSPRQMNDLRFIPFRSGARALVQNDQTKLKFGRKRKDGSRRVTGETIGGGVMYWLVESVTIRPNRAVLPTDAEMSAGAMRGVHVYVDTMIARRTRK